MTNDNNNPVDRDLFLQRARDCGLDVVEQSAYFRCSTTGSPARIYVAKTQKVTRVDFADFCPEAVGVRSISAEEAKEQRLGKVRGQLDFSQPEDVVLAAFTEACEQLKTVPQKTNEKKVRKAKKTTDVDDVVVAAALENDDETQLEVE